MKDPCLNVNLDVSDALKIDIKDYILSNPRRQNEVAIYKEDEIGIWSLDPEIIFTDNFLLSLFNRYDLVVGIVQLFMRKPLYQHPGAHCDMLPDGTILGAALNWCVGHDDSEMVWFEKPQTVFNKSNDSFAYVDHEWPRDTLIETHRHIIGNSPTLVRTDIPHTIDMKDHERWCISLRFHNNLNWDKCVKKLLS